MGFFQKVGEVLGDMVANHVSRTQKEIRRRGIDKKLDQYDRASMSAESQEKYDRVRNNVDRYLSADPEQERERVAAFFGNKTD